MDTIRLSLLPLEDECSEADVVKIEATELYRLDNGEAVWGVNPTVLYTNNSTRITEVVYDDLEVPVLRYVVWDQCCVTGVDVRICQCLKCRIYSGMALSQNAYTYVFVTEEQSSNIHYAHVCVEKPVESDTPSPPTIVPTDVPSGSPTNVSDSSSLVSSFSAITQGVAVESSGALLPASINTHATSEEEEIERLRHVQPHYRSHTGSNISIASSPSFDELSDDGSDDSMPGLLIGMSQFVGGSVVREEVWINTDDANTNTHLFGGTMDISTPLRTSYYPLVNSDREYSFIDVVIGEAATSSHSGTRWRATTRIPSHIYPHIVIVPVNNLRYPAQLLAIRNAENREPSWLRDDLRDNVIWMAGHYCMLSGIHVRLCSCGICERMESIRGVMVSRIHNWYFIRIVRSEFPYGLRSFNSGEDNRRLREYRLLDNQLQEKQRLEFRKNQYLMN